MHTATFTSSTNSCLDDLKTEPYTSSIMSAELKSKAIISKDVLFREVEGEAVLLNTQTGIYFGLEPIGVDIWKQLAAKKTFGAIVKKLIEDYEVDEKTCRDDLFRFTNHLEKNELIKVHED